MYRAAGTRIRRYGDSGSPSQLVEEPLILATPFALELLAKACAAQHVADENPECYKGHDAEHDVIVRHNPPDAIRPTATPRPRRLRT